MESHEATVGADAPELPNGIAIDLSEAGSEEWLLLLQLLCTLPYSGSTPY